MTLRREYTLNTSFSDVITHQKYMATQNKIVKISATSVHPTFRFRRFHEDLPPPLFEWVFTQLAGTLISCKASGEGNYIQDECIFPQNAASFLFGGS